MIRILRSAVLLALPLVCIRADTDRGVQLYNEGKYSEASTELQKAVDANGEDARAHRYLGLALLEQGNLDRSATVLARANELEASGDAKIALARLHIAKKEYDQAQQLLEGASGEDLEYARGLLRFHQGKYQEAVDDLEAQLKNKPDTAYAHYYAGMAYNKLGKTDRMLNHFDLFVQKRPHAPEAKKVRAVLRTGQ
jgi:tetratricopeptide (TPR) repeat protein